MGYAYYCEEDGDICAHAATPEASKRAFIDEFGVEPHCDAVQLISTSAAVDDFYARKAELPQLHFASTYVVDVVYD